MKRTAAVMLALGLSACAFNPQTAEITAEVDYRSSSIGEGTTVYLTVIDDRADQTIGHRGAGIAIAEITTETDVVQLFTGEVTKGLGANGFDVAGDSSGSPHLKVEIRLLEYTTSTGFWTGGIHTKSALKVIATSGDASYEEMYRTENEDRVVVVPTASKNEAYINAMVSDVLTAMFNDQQLLNFLAGQ